MEVAVDRVELPNGHQVDLDMVRHPGAAAVVPFISETDILLVRQYRWAAGGFIYEIPAGKLDHKGEEPLACARRELLEEVGQHATSLQSLGSIVTAPGFTDEVIHRTDGVTARLSFSAAVGGAVPVLERISRLAQRLDIEGIDGVLNGTCNYVLDRLAEGCEFSGAVREAQDRGFAEEDPSLDLTGKDSAYKLAVTAAVAFGAMLDPESIPCEGIDGLSTQEVQHAAQSGLALRLVARLTRTADGWAARVAPTPVPQDDPLAPARGEENVVVIRTRDGKTEVLHGKGAGRWPTTISVVADLLDLYRRRTRSRVAVDDSKAAVASLA